MITEYIKIAKNAKERGGSLIEGFYALESELGYIPRESLPALAEVFEMTAAQVYETASFYSYLNLEPTGKNIIRICRSAPCHVAGAQEVVRELECLLKIKMGETTPDRLFTLQYTGCVGQCGSSPCITINKEAYCDVTPQALPGILGKYSAEEM